MSVEATLTKKIREVARKEWGDSTSLTCKNQRSIPEDQRDGFALSADWGGVIFLTSSGQLKVFVHQGGEAEAKGWISRAAMGVISRDYPEIAFLMDKGEVSCP